MTIAALIAPSLMIAGVGLVHIGYFRRHVRGAQQQAVLLDELSYRGTGGRFRIPQGGPRALSGGRRTSGTYVQLSSSGACVTAPIEMFSACADAAAEGGGGRTMVARDARVDSGRFADTMIFAGDLRIEGECVFLGPVKVVGDLIVSGNAMFFKPLIVNGHASIGGSAVIRTGMLVKGEIAIAGMLIVGERGREGWVVARDIVNTGRMLINGHADAVNGSRRRGDKQIALAA